MGDMGPGSKWIDGLCRECSVDEAAQRSLEARLGAVAHWLPLAAHLADRDIEHVHRLRVSTRRAVAAIKLYRDWLPRKEHRWMRKRLKKVRRAAGDARDLDVFAQRLEREGGERVAPVLTMVAERRRQVQPAIVEVAERCRHEDQFVRRTSELLLGIRSPKDRKKSPMSFEDFARRQLHTSATEFFRVLPDDAADTTALHQFRIRSKELRYAIELLASGVEPIVRDEHYPVVEELQERLGRINDHVVARNQLIDWARTENVAMRELLCDLACHENVEAKSRLADFREWWTPSLVEKLSGLTQTARIR
jgi:CHAD domain-containing protein